jgi:hypothetical protein
MQVPSCGRFVDLDRHGHFRRHLAIPRWSPSPLRGERPEARWVMQPPTVDPTPQEPYSHALSLLRRAAIAPLTKIAAEAPTGS